MTQIQSSKASTAGPGGPARPGRPAEQASPAAAPADTVRLSGATSAPAGLTPEEAEFLERGFLPANYPRLKAIEAAQGVEAAKAYVRRDLKGPFADDYGEPAAMLQYARWVSRSPEVQRMVSDLRPGDVVLYTFNWNADVITQFTDGPFIHAMIYTGEGPPPGFIEAVGITGASGDPTTNRVRRVSLSRFNPDHGTYRVLKPAQDLPETQRERVVAHALRYAEAQLGKPYDYAFTNRNRGEGLTDAFYCSELPYLAYRAAGVELPIDKSAERDELFVAADALIAALGPRRKAETLDAVMKLLKREPKPTPAELATFLVDDVLAECRATAPLAASAAQRERLAGAVAAVLSGRAFPGAEKAAAGMAEAAESGAYDRPVIGGLRRAWSRAEMARAYAADAVSLARRSGLNPLTTGRAFAPVLRALVTHSEAILGHLYGEDDARARSAGRMLDVLGWVDRRMPLDGLPAAPTPRLKRDFVSPSDLAWADVPHEDYNVRPGKPLDAAAWRNEPPRA